MKEQIKRILSSPAIGHEDEMLADEVMELFKKQVDYAELDARRSPPDNLEHPCYVGSLEYQLNENEKFKEGFLRGIKAVRERIR